MTKSFILKTNQFILYWYYKIDVDKVKRSRTESVKQNLATQKWEQLFVSIFSRTRLRNI